MDYPADTIAAVATAPGTAALCIVRLSGPDAVRIARELTGRELPAPRHARLTSFLAADGQPLDQGLVLHFPAPHSFTGEDVVELQGHGGALLPDLLLARVLELGARAASPGEFSLRAFFNERLDLAQAEAIADLIASRSPQAARAAMRSLSGDLSRLVHELVDALTELRVYVEAAIDFPDEEIDFLADEQLCRRLDALEARFSELTQRSEQGRLLQEGMTVVIAGPPNAGKSSLLNTLSGEDTAIVSELPGTTRDVLRTRVRVRGIPIHLIDTAGLRVTSDVVEREGVRRARTQIENADLLLLVLDAALETALPDDLLEGLPDDAPRLVLLNKCDLPGTAPTPPAWAGAALCISARTGLGLDALRERLATIAGYNPETADPLGARRRHLDALRRAQRHLEDGARQLRDHHAGELLAEELRLAQEALGEITGRVTSDELLGRIFSSFCIGK